MGLRTSSIEEDFAFITYHSKEEGSSAVESDHGQEGQEDKGEDPLRVRRDAFWSYCGPLLEATGTELPPSLHEWSAAALTGSVLGRLLPFLEFINGFVAEKGLDHYWLTIRATTPTTEYDRPRWHTDDMFFSRSNEESPSPPPLVQASAPRRSRWSLTKPPKGKEEEHHGQQQQLDLETDWKVCTTLLGPSTLFVPAAHQSQARERQRHAKEESRRANEHACNSIRCVGCATAADAVRSDLDGSLTDLGVVQAGPGQCAFFRIGPERGAVHSEPCMNGRSDEEGDEGTGGGPEQRGRGRGRIFVNVVPGKREELERLVGKWGMEFPRSWWIAPSSVVS
ncbi:hypothetical protein PG995_007258 [Apiospora arundinis]|uniref:Uncharacterized protein n=1 Tax=Apiospora arundinis TaxID=335852 RepID=A0ABR2JGV0_9PEZI